MCPNTFCNVCYECYSLLNHELFVIEQWMYSYLELKASLLPCNNVDSQNLKKMFKSNRHTTLPLTHIGVCFSPSEVDKSMTGL